jgi:tetratricopeptide (TPR) repeat protein
MLAPVGPTGTQQLLQPVGPAPTKGVDLPAPKGFFDDIPAPRSTIGRPAQPAPVPSLDLDDLDIVPPSLGAGPGRAFPDGGGATAGSAPLIDLEEMPARQKTPVGPAPTPSSASFSAGTGAPPSFAMDGLDLLPPDPGASPASPGASSGGMSYGEVDLGGHHDDLPQAEENSAPGVVSFAKPSAAARAAAESAGSAAAEPPPIGEIGVGPQRKKLGTIADDAQPVARVGGEAGRQRGKDTAQAEKKTRSPEQIRRQRILLGVVLVVVVLGGAGFYVYTQVDAKILGIKTQPYVAREEMITQGILATRKFMAADDPGHWDKAAREAQKVIGLDAEQGEAAGLFIQAHLAAVIDEGLGEKAHLDAADAQITAAVKQGIKHPEFEKAQALRELLEDKPADAKKRLAAVGQRLRGDPDIPLYHGWIALEMRDWASAQRNFEAAISRAPNRIPALYGLGVALAALGEKDKAKAQFEKVLDKRPDRKHFGAWLGITEMIPPDREGTREKTLGIMVERAHERETANPRDLGRAWTLYADEAYVKNNIDTAAERYRKAIEIDKRNLDALVGVALTSLEQGKKEDARGRLQSVLALDPKHPGMLIGLTRLALLDGKPADAFAAISQAVQAAPKNAQVQLWLGHVLAADPSVDPNQTAETAYRAAIDLAPPEDYQAQVALARLLGRTPGREADAVAILAPVEKAALADSVLANTLGEAYLGVKDAPAAEKWFRQALTVNAANATARSNLGAALELAGRMPEALVEYEAAYKTDEKTEEIALRLALAYEKAKRPAAAKAVYTGLLDESQGRQPSITARAAAGRFFARRGEAAAAKQQGEAILAVDPRYPAGLFLRGFGLLADGKLNDAQKDITDAIGIDPQAQYWDGLGRVFEKQNLLSEALGRFEKAIDTDGAYVAPRLGRARIRMLRAEWGKALTELEEAAKLEPENADVWARIGESHYNLRELPAAAKAFLEAVRRDPTRPDVYFMLGRTIDEDPRGRPRDAVSNLQKAITLARELNVAADWEPEAWRIMGFALRETGDKGGACDALRRYLEIAPPTDGLRKEAERVVLSCP